MQEWGCCGAHDTPHHFAVASEIRQLKPLLSNISCNMNMLSDFMVLGYSEHSNQTFFENIHTLLPSSNLIFNINSLNFVIKKYYTLSPTKNIPHDFKELKEIYRSLLTSSVNLRMRSDVSIGIALSGGLDSSTIASLASAQNNKIIAFTTNTPEASELHYAKMISEKNNFDLHVISPQKYHFLSNLEKLIDTQEEPFGGPSIFMQIFLFQKAREQGCTVLLSGQGADETILGYERYLLMQYSGLNPFKIFDQAHGATKNSRLSLYESLAYHAYFNSYQVRKYLLKRKHALLNKKFRKYANFSLLKASSRKNKNPLDLQKIEIESLQLPHLLRYEDKNSMALSIESRLPFLDYRLVEFSLALPMSAKIQQGWTKYILREAFQDILPPTISWRKEKLGFTAPEKEWLSTPENSIISTIHSSSLIRHICGTENLKKISAIFYRYDLRNRWKMLNIALWDKLYF